LNGINIKGVIVNIKKRFLATSKEKESIITPKRLDPRASPNPTELANHE
jgi:hypothetical protein